MFAGHWHGGYAGAMLSLKPWADRRRRRSEAQLLDELMSPAGEIADDYHGSLEQLFEEIARLSELNRSDRQAARDRELLRLRHIAGARLVIRGDTAAEIISGGISDLPESDPVPTLNPDHLDARALRSGILRSGCVLVRGLFDRYGAVDLADAVNRAFDDRELANVGRPQVADAYEPFHTLRPFALTGIARAIVAKCCGFPIVDAPVTACEVLWMFEDAGVPRLMRDYLGEPPLIAAQKTTLRKVDPPAEEASSSWHQDASIFRGDVHAINMWIPLTRCGDDAPGLDIIPKHMDRLVEPDTTYPGKLSSARAGEAGGDTPILRPLFEPGDALFFDDLFLHSTPFDPKMTRARYGIESWFFGASGFPADYTPLAI